MIKGSFLVGYQTFEQSRTESCQHDGYCRIFYKRHPGPVQGSIPRPTRSQPFCLLCANTHICCQVIGDSCKRCTLSVSQENHLNFRPKNFRVDCQSKRISGRQELESIKNQIINYWLMVITVPMNEFIITSSSWKLCSCLKRRITVNLQSELS